MSLKCWWAKKKKKKRGVERKKTGVVGGEKREERQNDRCCIHTEKNEEKGQVKESEKNTWGKTEEIMRG